MLNTDPGSVALCLIPLGTTLGVYWCVRFFQPHWVWYLLVVPFLCCALFPVYGEFHRTFEPTWTGCLGTLPQAGYLLEWVLFFILFGGGTPCCCYLEGKTYASCSAETESTK